MANVDPFATSKMLNALQHIGLAAQPRETKNEKDEQVEAMDIEEEEDDWIGDLLETYASKGLEAVVMIINSPTSAPHAPINVPHAPVEEKSILIELDEEWIQELTRDVGEDHASNMQRMDQD